MALNGTEILLAANTHLRYVIFFDDFKILISETFSYIGLM
jgi:hypothetical protein